MEGVMSEPQIVSQSFVIVKCHLSLIFLITWHISNANPCLWGLGKVQKVAVVSVSDCK